MNEATIEANINGILKQTMPFMSDLELVHQKSFNIRLGHKIIPIENSKNFQKGIADVIVYINREPLLLFELKKENENIDSEVINQAVSYSRLTDPIIPITVVSNTRETLFINSFTKEKIENFKDFDSLKKYVINSVSVSNDSIQQSIDKIFFSNQEIIEEFLIEISGTKFNKLKGSANSLMHIISDRVFFTRDIVKEISIEVENKTNFLIYGYPFAGKTNILYQLYLSLKEKKYIPIYIDLLYDYSIFEQLGQELSSLLGIIITKEKIKHYLKNIIPKSQTKFIFLLDNLHVNDSYDREIRELIHLTEDSNTNIIITLDKSAYDQLIKKRGRVSSNIYENFVNKEIGDLNRNELIKISEEIFHSNKIILEKGYIFYKEYSNPYFLNLMIQYALHAQESKDTVVSIPSVPSIEQIFSYIEEIKKNIDPEVDFLHRKLAEIFLIDKENRPFDPYQLLFSIGNIFITTNTLEKNLENENVKYLLENGYIERKFFNEKEMIYIPQLQFLVLYYLSEMITDKLLFLKSQGIGINEIVSIFLESCYTLPLEDSLGAAILLKLIKKDTNFALNLIFELSLISPKREFKQDKHLSGLVQIGNDVPIEIETELDENDFFTTDYSPWLILSQLLRYPFLVNQNDVFYLDLLKKIGSYNDILFRIDNYTKLNPISVHEFGNKLNFLCMHDGIIEPVTHAIKSALYFIDSYNKTQYIEAIFSNNLSYAYRIFNAALSLIYINDNKIQSKCAKIIKIHNKYFSQKVHEVMANKIMKPNDKCYCGSNLSFKDCHSDAIIC